MGVEDREGGDRYWMDSYSTPTPVQDEAISAAERTRKALVASRAGSGTKDGAEVGEISPLPEQVPPGLESG